MGVQNLKTVNVHVKNLAPKTFEEKRINQLKSVKAKGLKRGFKKYMSDNEFKSVTLYEKPLRIIQTNKIKKL